jgi:peptide/nickel transport system permease protein
VSPAAELTATLPTLVYAAVQDRESSVNVTKVYVLRAETGQPLSSWDPTPGGNGGLPIAFRGVERGVPNTPAVVGTSIFITTSTGWLYNIIRDPIFGENDVLKVPAGSVQWAYQDLTFQQDATHRTSFTAAPYVFQNLRLLIAVATYNNGTARFSDDIGIIYVFGEATGSLTWKKTFPSGIYAMPVAWRDPNHVHEAVWFGTYRGDVYSYSTSGQYLAPLPPSWSHEYFDPDTNEWRSGYASGNTYILGTDARGRDIFSQLIWGSRVALLVGFASAFFTISIGVIVGLVAGYLGGRVESILMRFTDVILVIPGLPLVIILAAVLGAGIGNIILVIAIVGWPGVARVIRAEVLSLKERPFIDSARVTGASNVRIMFRHVAPNVAPLAFLYMTFAVSGAILTEAALSFIGLGDANTISWGIMLQDVSQSKALQAWWWLLPPGLAITLISLAFFLVGRAFDEIVNPRLRKR